MGDQRVKVDGLEEINATIPFLYDTIDREYVLLVLWCSQYAFCAGYSLRYYA